MEDKWHMEAGKGKETGSFLGQPEAVLPADALIFNP
jgi:hypothetical protein